MYGYPDAGYYNKGNIGSEPRMLKAVQHQARVAPRMLKATQHLVEYLTGLTPVPRAGSIVPSLKDAFLLFRQRASQESTPSPDLVARLRTQRFLDDIVAY